MERKEEEDPRNRMEAIAVDQKTRWKDSLERDTQCVRLKDEDAREGRQVGVRTIVMTPNSNKVRKI